MQPIPVMEGAVESSAVTGSFIAKVYMWMAAGLLTTSVISAAPYFVMGVNEYENFVYENIFIFFGLMVLEFLIVLGLTFLINRIPAIVAAFVFLFYSFLNGITIGPILLFYTSASVFSTFFVCACMFGGASLLGIVTKIDLTRVGGFLMMALFGLIGTMIVNIFLQSGIMNWIISLAGVIIFVGLTAYDTQKLKNMNASVDSSTEQGAKASVLGALTLYLDFINLFLFLLRLLGKRR